MVGLSVTPTLLCIKERRSIALARHWLDEVLSGSIGPDRGARALHEAARRKHPPARLPRAGLRASRHRCAPAPRHQRQAHRHARAGVVPTMGQPRHSALIGGCLWLSAWAEVLLLCPLLGPPFNSV